MTGKFNWKINFYYQPIPKGGWFVLLTSEKLEPRQAMLKGHWGYPVERINNNFDVAKNQAYLDDMRRG